MKILVIAALLLTVGMLESRAAVLSPGKNGFVETRWPNGNLRSRVQYLADVYHGEYRTWTIDGQPYELKHFAYGREEGRQQSWDADGQLYLNYEVRGGRKYGMANAKPCLPHQ